MNYIGLDIGTTSISAVLINSTTGEIIKKKTALNNTKETGSLPWEQLQDPDAIVAICQKIYQEFCSLEGEEKAMGDCMKGDASCGAGDRIAGVGLTGQMHGILYVDEEGKAVSPLITWQDERGNQTMESGKTYVEKIYEMTGIEIAAGYGLATVFFDFLSDKIPKRASSIVTIGDYVGMRLTGRAEPLMHVSNGASLGLFDLKKGDFDGRAIAKLGIPQELLPKITRTEGILGVTEEGIPVAIPIGDNQASFAGAVGMREDVLVNIGTGSQISALCQESSFQEGLEWRPYLEGKYLVAGAGLCGGSAYAMLKDFFCETLKVFGAKEPEGMYTLMDEAAAKADEPHIIADTRFRGTRKNPGRGGMFGNIGTDNFTPGQMAYAVMQGTGEELYGFYEKMGQYIAPPKRIVASGNAIRNSLVEQKIISEIFHTRIAIPVNQEEAAFGAAMNAIHCVEGREWDHLQELIAYREE